MSQVDLTVPDIGNFEDILVVDVLVKKGDTIEVDAPLVTLETDKASMDVPATTAGTITEVLLKAGDKVSKAVLLPVSILTLPLVPPPSPLLRRPPPMKVSSARRLTLMNWSAR